MEFIQRCATNRRGLTYDFQVSTNDSRNGAEMKGRAS
jgi:hypothetical protein